MSDAMPKDTRKLQKAVRLWQRWGKDGVSVEEALTVVVLQRLVTTRAIETRNQFIYLASQYLNYKSSRSWNDLAILAYMEILGYW